jgi:predicted carbohydrate-binding protein with CBM5 and CBM33 domain
MAAPPTARSPRPGSPQFGELNAQTSDRWTKREGAGRPFAISWTFTANHVTRNWRYYLTKQDWNPNQPLTRTAFDLNPFCVIDGNMVQPPKQVTHQCTLPAAHRLSGHPRAKSKVARAVPSTSTPS